MTSLSFVAELHNELRKKHGVPLLELELDLCIAADEYAAALVAGKKGDEPDKTIGRSVHQGKIKEAVNEASTKEFLKQALDKWTGHSKEYNWESPTSSGKDARLFTNMVWKSSVNLGVGVANNNGNIVLVCLYTPIGNITDGKKSRENVLKPKK